MKHPFITLFLSCILIAPVFEGKSQPIKFFKQAGMPVGAYYYPEHWPENQWERDIKKISELGFAFTHFAEFAWARLEPEEGRYNFEWLDKCVEMAGHQGLKVIMCTPTPCPPAWLTEKHPEILVANANGTKFRHGTRLHANGAHPVYQEYIKKMILEMTKRYGKDKHVWGWQISNEPHFRGLYDYSGFARDEFIAWLKEKYAPIDQLNKAWGAPFWSMTYNRFEQIRLPNKEVTETVNPHALLDFQRFNAELLARDIRFQSSLLKKNISDNQFITTNYAYYKFLPSVDLFENQEDLDFASHTMYLLSTYLNYPPGDKGFRLGSGLELSFSGEFARSVNGYTGIMELQPGQINWGQWNAQPLPGAVRMWVWHAYALGDRFTCAYRFRQPLFGGEQYHKGIMETDGITLSTGGKEYVQALQEIKQLEKLELSNNQMPGKVASRKTAFLWKQDNLMSLENTKHTGSWKTYQHYYTYYSALKSMGCPVTFIQETDHFDPEKHPFMIAPAYELIDTHLVEKWKRYVAKGGHLILSCRTGMKDKNGHLWESLLQEPIWDLIGARINYYDHLPPGRKGLVQFEEKQYTWQSWGDILQTMDNTEPWARYKDQFYEGQTCVSHVKQDKGSVTYLGVWTLDGEMEKQVLRKVYRQAGANTFDLPDYVFTEWRDGAWVTMNYRSVVVQAPLGKGAKIIFGKEKVKPGGVTVWVE